MASKDIHSLLEIDFLFNIDNITSNGIDIGSSIVFDAEGLLSAEFVMVSIDEGGDGTFNFVPKHGDTNVFSQHVNVPANELLGPSLTITQGNTISKQGYIGKKRFLSANIIASGVGEGRNVGVIIVANSPRRAGP